MPQTCAQCGTDIDGADVRYTEHGADGTTTYCSVNCIADLDHVDEDDARDRLFTDPVEA